jgi:hypothetical protein
MLLVRNVNPEGKMNHTKWWNGSHAEGAVPASTDNLPPHF